MRIDELLDLIGGKRAADDIAQAFDDAVLAARALRLGKGAVPQEELAKYYAWVADAWRQISRYLPMTTPVVRVPISQRFSLYVYGLNYWARQWTDLARTLSLYSKTDEAAAAAAMTFFPFFAWGGGYKGMFQAIYQDVLPTQLARAGQLVRKPTTVAEKAETAMKLGQQRLKAWFDDMADVFSFHFESLLQSELAGQAVPQGLKTPFKEASGAELVLDLGNYAHSLRSSVRRALENWYDLVFEKTKLYRVFGISDDAKAAIRRMIDELPAPRTAVKATDPVDEVVRPLIPPIVSETPKKVGAPGSAVRIGEDLWSVSFVPRPIEEVATMVVRADRAPDGTWRVVQVLGDAEGKELASGIVAETAEEAVRRAGYSVLAQVDPVTNRFRVTEPRPGQTQWGVYRVEAVPAGENKWEFWIVTKRGDEVKRTFMGAAEGRTQAEALEKLGYNVSEGFWTWRQRYAPYYAPPEEPHEHWISLARKALEGSDLPPEQQAVAARRLAEEAQRTYNEFVDLVYYNRHFRVYPAAAYLKLIGGPRWLRTVYKFKAPLDDGRLVRSFTASLERALQSTASAAPGIERGVPTFMDLDALKGLIARRIAARDNLLEKMVLESRALTNENMDLWKRIIVSNALQEAIGDVVEDMAAGRLSSFSRPDEVIEYIDEVVSRKLHDIVTRLDHEMWSLRLHTDWIDEFVWKVFPLGVFWRPTSLTIFRPAIQVTSDWARSQVIRRADTINQILSDVTKSFRNAVDSLAIVGASDTAIAETKARFRKHIAEAFRRYIQSLRAWLPPDAESSLDDLVESFERQIASLDPGSPTWNKVVYNAMQDAAVRVVNDLSKRKSKWFFTWFHFKRWFNNLIDSAIGSFDAAFRAPLNDLVAYRNLPRPVPNMPPHQSVLAQVLYQDFIAPTLNSLASEGQLSSYFEAVERMPAILADASADVWATMPPEVRRAVKEAVAAASTEGAGSADAAQLAADVIRRWLDENPEAWTAVWQRTTYNVSKFISERPYVSRTLAESWKLGETYTWGIHEEPILRELAEDFLGWLTGAEIRSAQDLSNEVLGLAGKLAWDLARKYLPSGNADEVRDLAEFLTYQLQLAKPELERRLRYALWEHAASWRRAMVDRFREEGFWKAFASSPEELVDWKAPWEVLDAKSARALRDATYTMVLSDLLSWAEMRLGALVPFTANTYLLRITDAVESPELLRKAVAGEGEWDLTRPIFTAKEREALARLAEKPESYLAYTAATPYSDLSHTLANLEPWADMWIAGHMPWDLTATQRLALHRLMMERARDYLARVGIPYLLAKHTERVDAALARKGKPEQLFSADWLRREAEVIKRDLAKYLESQLPELKRQVVENPPTSVTLNLPKWEDAARKFVMPSPQAPKVAAQYIEHRRLMDAVDEWVKRNPEAFVFYLREAVRTRTKLDDREAWALANRLYNAWLAMDEATRKRVLGQVHELMQRRMQAKSPAAIIEGLPWTSPEPQVKVFIKADQQDVDWALKAIADSLASGYAEGRIPEPLLELAEDVPLERMMELEQRARKALRARKAEIERLIADELPKFTGVSSRALGPAALTPDYVRAKFMSFCEQPGPLYRLGQALEKGEEAFADEIRKLWEEFLILWSRGARFAARKGEAYVQVGNPFSREALKQEYIKGLFREGGLIYDMVVAYGLSTNPAWREEFQRRMSLAANSEFDEEMQVLLKRYPDGWVPQAEYTEALSRITAQLEKTAAMLAAEVRKDEIDWETYFGLFFDDSTSDALKLRILISAMNGEGISPAEIEYVLPILSEGAKLLAKLGFVVPLHQTIAYLDQFAEALHATAKAAIAGREPKPLLTRSYLERLYYSSGASAFERDPKLLVYLEEAGERDDYRRLMEALIFMWRNHIWVPNMGPDFEGVALGFRKLASAAADSPYLRQAVYLWDWVVERAGQLSLHGFAAEAIPTNWAMNRAKGNQVVDTWGRVYTEREAEELWRKELLPKLRSGDPEVVLQVIEDFLIPFANSDGLFGLREWFFGSRWSQRLQAAIRAWERLTGRELPFTRTGTIRREPEVEVRSVTERAAETEATPPTTEGEG